MSTERKGTMRKPVLVVTLVLMAATVVLMRGRVAAGQEGQRISPNIETRPDGHVRLNVLNSSGSPITAIAAVGIRTLVAKPITVRSVRFFDSILNPYGPKEIMPDETYAFTFFGPNPPPDQITWDVQIKAAIFADGSTWGDPNWITILLLRRSSALKYDGEAMRAMEAASLGGSTRKDLVQQLTQRRSVEIKAAGTTAEKQMADATFSNALLALQDSRRIDGGDIPLSESIAHARSRLLADTIRLQASKPAPIN